MYFIFSMSRHSQVQYTSLNPDRWTSWSYFCDIMPSHWLPKSPKSNEITSILIPFSTNKNSIDFSNLILFWRKNTHNIPWRITAIPAELYCNLTIQINYVVKIFVVESNRLCVRFKMQFDFYIVPTKRSCPF